MVLSLVLVILLRLRQICVHPALIQEGEDAVLELSDFGVNHGKNSELARAKRLVSEDFVERMKKKLKEISLERTAAEKQVSSHLRVPERVD